MKQDFNHIDEIFRAELNDYSPELPANAWNNISNAMAQTRQKRVSLFFSRNWKIAASVALLVSTGSLATYILLNKHNADNISQTNTQAVPNQAANIVSEQEHNHLVNQQNQSRQQASKTDKTLAYVKTPGQAITENYAAQTIENTAQFPAETDHNESVKNLPSELIQEPQVAVESAAGADIARSSESQNQRSVAEIVKNPTTEPTPENYIWEASQDELNSNAGKWIVGGQAGPQYSYRTLSSDYYSSDLIDKNNSSENGVVAYAGGVNVEYKTTRRFSIQSGIIYSKMGVEQLASATRSVSQYQGEAPGKNETASVDNVSNYVFPVASVQIGPKIGASSNNTESDNMSLNYNSSITENAINEIPSWRNYEYIEVPIIARYAVIDRKINMHILGGLSTNILVNNSISVQTPDNTTNLETQFVNTINYSSTLGVGLSYDISGQLIMSVEPQFKYFLNSQVYNSNINLHPYSLGIFTGVKYLF